ncbi:MAG: glycosyltransferase [Calothrix sp. MO_167.B12]|nr:glycosyltransferase [Calothrix sp. MO_167.B12]
MINSNLKPEIKPIQKVKNNVHVMHVVDKLSVSGSGIHGVTRAIERWIPRFDKKEFKFSICSLRTPEVASELFESQGIPVHFLSKSKFDPRILTSLLDLVRRERPHILHLHGYGATNFGRVVSLLTGIPNIIHEHVVIPNQPIYQTIADTILSPLSKKVIACSDPVKEFMISDRKVRPEKIETLFYGLPLAEFRPPPHDICENERLRLGLASDDKVVCNVGRLDTQKGQIFLLKAAVSILKEFPKTRFLIVGEGPDRSMLESITQQERISDQVIFTGFRQDVPTLLALSDIVAMPSLWEGLPISLVEAMNMRKPVVGTTAGGMGSAIRDGETGYIVPFKNVDLLAEKIIYLLKDSHLAQRMGEKGWEVCQNNYDISNSVQRLSEIYRELVDQNN